MFLVELPLPVNRPGDDAPPRPGAPRRVTIVGGGFVGVSAAVQLLRRSPAPLAITLIEAREVDAQCRAIGADGQARDRVRLIGPPTLGTFGDPGGAMYIAAQVHRMVPDVLGTLGVGAVQYQDSAGT